MSTCERDTTDLMAIEDLYSQRGLSVNHRSDASVEVLPVGEEQSLIFSGYAGEIIGKMRGNDITASLHQDGRGVRCEVREAAEIVLPMILVQSVVLPLAVSVLANYIYDRWIRKPGGASKQVRAEIAIVREDGDVFIEAVEGTAQDVAAALREIDGDLPDGSRDVSEVTTGEQ